MNITSCIHKVGSGLCGGARLLPVKALTALTLLLAPACCPGARAADTPTERHMKQQGMVDIQQIDPTIKVSLMYSRADNFTGRVLYTDGLADAFTPNDESGYTYEALA